MIRLLRSRASTISVSAQQKNARGITLRPCSTTCCLGGRSVAPVVHYSWRTSNAAINKVGVMVSKFGMEILFYRHHLPIAIYSAGKHRSKKNVLNILVI